MRSHSSRLCRLMVLFLCVLFAVFLFSSAGALESGTLYNGCKGEEVRELQDALIRLGYLKGTADGVFGNNTENAVRKFQKKNKLVSDGLAGEKTRSLILSQAANSVSKQESSAKSADTSQKDSSSSAGSSLFSSNYASLRLGSKGDRVKSLQQALISLGYLTGNADGVFGNKTRSAVKTFQKKMKLSADGVAGKKTLAALESAMSGGKKQADVTPVPTAAPVTPSDEPVQAGDLNEKISGPSSSSIQLLHWFNTVKPSLSGGQKLLVFDPASGYSWTLRILARGRHCDAEPLTAKDTRTMIAAFGGINTWNQKAVYVRLPDGRWSLASTHDMPHDSGSIKDNDFNGHLCVHFLRDMDEAQKNDPNYGVANQVTIRSWWKKLTGEEIP